MDYSKATHARPGRWLCRPAGPIVLAIALAFAGPLAAQDVRNSGDADSTSTASRPAKPDKSKPGREAKKPAREDRTPSKPPASERPAKPEKSRPITDHGAARPDAPRGRTDAEERTIETSTDAVVDEAAPGPAEETADALPPDVTSAEEAEPEGLAELSADQPEAPEGAAEEETPDEAARPSPPSRGARRPIVTTGSKATPSVPSVVSRDTERSRNASVRRSLRAIGETGEEGPRTQDERLAAAHTLINNARMQLATLRTELSRTEDERDTVIRHGKELRSQVSRLPSMMRRGRLPLIYAVNARTRAEETVAEMNDIFDRSMTRRSELSEALAEYAEDARALQTFSRDLRAQALSKSLASARQVLQDRRDTVEKLVAVLDEIIAEAVSVSETSARVSIELTTTIRATRSRRLLTRTAEPLNTEAFILIADELSGLRERSAQGVVAVSEGVRSARKLPATLTSVLLLALFAVLWYAASRLTARLSQSVEKAMSATSRATRAVSLLVPAGRALLLMALVSGLVRAWGLPEAWSASAVMVLAFWVAYYLLTYTLRELLAPKQPQFRILKVRDEVAVNLYAVVSSLALYTAILSPVIFLLNGLDQRPTETVRALQIIYGMGVLLIGVWMTRRSGGLMALLPEPSTRQRTAIQQTGRLVVPLCALGILGAVVAAAGGYSNLSAYLNRSLSLEILLLIGAVFIFNLVLRDQTERAGAAWRRYALWAFWLVVGLLQLPIWRIQPFHATYLVDLLNAPIIQIADRSVSGFSIGKGLLVVLACYGLARLARSRLYNWAYLTDRFQSGVAYALSSLAFYTILAAGMLWGILASGFELSVLTVFAGMAGIGLGFGLQDVVKNFISGLILLVERPVAVGDFVEIGDLRGYITAINLRSTTIRSRENNVVLVPNSDLASTRVTNLTLSDARVRLNVDVGVSYDSNLDRVRQIILECTSANPQVLDDPEPRVLLMNFGDSSVDFTLWAWVRDADMALVIAPELRQQIWDAFLEHDIEIPFPQQDLHIRSSDISLPYAGEQLDETVLPAPQDDDQAGKESHDA